MDSGWPFGSSRGKAEHTVCWIVDIVMTSDECVLSGVIEGTSKIARGRLSQDR
jgi:hypothetical protein